jgi:catechol 2,3-dioxygenase-like lactoylglutathione lyase family enzyme
MSKPRSYQKVPFVFVLITLGMTSATGAQTTVPTTRPHIGGLSHIAIFVHDIDRSRAFYKDYLGFAEPFSLNNPDGTLKLTWIKINDHQTIELFPERQAGALRLNHIAIETDDAEALRLYLESRGVAVPAKTGIGGIGNANFTFRTPPGHLLEVTQYRPEGWTMREKGKFMPETRISSRLTHIGVGVQTLETGIKFYCDVLGFREVARDNGDATHPQRIDLRVPDGDDCVELFLASGDEPKTSGHYVRLGVPSAERALATLSARALPAECKPPLAAPDASGKQRIETFDPDGTRVELAE